MIIQVKRKVKIMATVCILQDRYINLPLGTGMNFSPNLIKEGLKYTGRERSILLGVMNFGKILISTYKTKDKY